MVISSGPSTRHCIRTLYGQPAAGHRTGRRPRNNQNPPSQSQYLSSPHHTEEVSMTQQHPPRHGPRPSECARTTDGTSFTEHVVEQHISHRNHWTRSFAVASANRNFGGLHGHMSTQSRIMATIEGITMSTFSARALSVILVVLGLTNIFLGINTGFGAWKPWAGKATASSFRSPTTSVHHSRQPHPFLRRPLHRDRHLLDHRAPTPPLPHRPAPRVRTDLRRRTRQAQVCVATSSPTPTSPPP